MPYDLTVIIPTLNEAKTIRTAVNTVNPILESNRINAEILIVDDNSTDGTLDIARDIIAAHSNVHLLVRLTDHGLSNSLVDGFHYAAANTVMVIDCDGQWSFEKIPELYRAITDGNDIALGSRYMGVPGSGFEGLAYYRRVISWGATILARFFFPEVTDSGSGFFAFRKEVILNAPLKPQGFRMLFEILGKGHWKTVKEIPTVFGVRKQGESKLKMSTIISYLKQLWGLFTFSISNPDSHGYSEIKRVLTYVLVGLSGIVVCMTTTYLLTEIVGMWYILSATLGLEFSILSNFALNDIITFSDYDHKRSWEIRISIYHLVSLGGVIITLGTMALLTERFGVWYMLSGFVGVVLAFAWNFGMNRGITWRKK
jgi:dolichol-phosphate mannosyltransferase